MYSILEGLGCRADIVQFIISGPETIAGVIAEWSISEMV